MATLLSFLFTIAYVPGWAGAALTPRWAMLAVAVPLIILRRKVLPHVQSTLRTHDARPTRGVFWLSVAFLAWATLSMLWTPSPWDGLFSLEQWALWFGVGYIGYKLDDARPVYTGCALGMGVVSILIILEINGHDLIRQSEFQHRAGLFFNPNIVTETGVLVLVACLAYGMWTLGLVTALPAIVLTHSRGGLVALASGGLYCAFKRSLWWGTAAAGLIFLLALGLWWFNHTETVDNFRGGMLINPASWQDRLNIWRHTLHLLTWTGNGVGSFRVMFPSEMAGYSDYAHSDYLQLAQDFGFPGVALIGTLLFLAMNRPYRPETLVVIAFLIEAVFQFPTWMPVSGMLGALAIGRLFR